MTRKHLPLNSFYSYDYLHLARHHYDTQTTQTTGVLNTHSTPCDFKWKTPSFNLCISLRFRVTASYSLSGQFCKYLTRVKPVFLTCQASTRDTNTTYATAEVYCAIFCLLKKAALVQTTNLIVFSAYNTVLMLKTNIL